MKPTKVEHTEVAHLGSESKFQTLVESSVQGIAVHRDFKFLFANGTMAKMLGYSSVAELMELDVLGQVIRPHERADAVAGYQAVLRGVPIDNPIESCILKKDGSEIWVERIHSRIGWEGLPALLATLFDITARKTAEIARRMFTIHYAVSSLISAMDSKHAANNYVDAGRIGRVK